MKILSPKQRTLKSPEFRGNLSSSSWNFLKFRGENWFFFFFFHWLSLLRAFGALLLYSINLSFSNNLLTSLTFCSLLFSICPSRFYLFLPLRHFSGFWRRRGCKWIYLITNTVNAHPIVSWPTSEYDYSSSDQFSYTLRAPVSLCFSNCKCSLEPQHLLA